MCGILGRLTTKNSRTEFTEYRNSLETLFRLSESRGKEASGLCCMTDDAVAVLKSDLAASDFVKRTEYSKCLKMLENGRMKFAMGHARMITNGDSANSENNQPIVRDDLVVIHNGIIVNDEDLWKKNENLIRNAEVDTEVFLALLEKYEYREDFLSAFKRTLSKLEGSLSIAMIDRNSDWLFLYTNVGSLYVAINDEQNDYIFASERYIVERTINSISRNVELIKKYKIFHIKPDRGVLINTYSGEMRKYKAGEIVGEKVVVGEKNRQILLNSIMTKKNNSFSFNIDAESRTVEKMMKVDISAIHKLRRCTKCLLPETFPGITYDSDGVCNICNNYKPIKSKGKEELISDIERNREASSRYECISPISGGRDSCYILHYLVNELHLKPVAYTYDWGLVTDLARRNIQRMCAALGVEHVLISADISRKRSNVKKNVEAWLEKPSLGTVPLFMAGDKQFFYYAQLLKRQMRIDNVIFGMNKLEETQFKARFIGLKPQKKDDLYYDFSSSNKIKLALEYGKEFISNPKYINNSLLDSFTGFLSYYVLPQKYLRFFDYIPWDQKTIETTLINKYNWETAKDVTETWRIGDGTAPFYNYIYYRLAGFTEFDTFMSNQIREGMITREEAISKIDKSNRISIEGFLWYCHTIGIDPIKTVKIINKQKTLYED